MNYFKLLVLILCCAQQFCTNQDNLWTDCFRELEHVREPGVYDQLCGFHLKCVTERDCDSNSGGVRELSGNTEKL